MAAETRVPTAYSEDHAAIYDFVHGARGRDWKAEADRFAEIVREQAPRARSLLDVACGTGAHLESFRQHFPTVAGLELSPGMREIARSRLPAQTVHAGDMRDFDLGTRFDAVLCLCFSMGYMKDTAELAAAAEALVRHLAPGGVLIVEPWWFPEQFADGFVSASLAQDGNRAVSRISHSVREGRVSRMTVRYTVADSEGIRDFTEYETYSLFTEEEYRLAFREAGCEVEFRPGWPNLRGLFVGTLPSAR
ncbi:class I SAM-dependent methyltransferase [Streptomyces sp. XM4193]|uniref:class I SAM-dependent DNA methyltransferase n=1 Tax=Streptomyces sp. XM4193 TaxID=2929782 RepID=UPI001FFBBE83|nr:class I SAM-dependent methyltransferase [Streptomyces sp. XM4193]MCK1798563.1 class I SAM-dependent methyltransferase [Streptomyces sp. XM4193]